MFERLKKSVKGVGAIGGLILSLVTAMVTIFIALLLGGVLSAKIQEQYVTFEVTGVWWNLFNSTTSIATSAIGIAIIGFLIAAFMIVLSMLGVFGGRGRR